MWSHDSNIIPNTRKHNTPKFQIARVESHVDILAIVSFKSYAQIQLFKTKKMALRLYEARH